MSSSRSDNEQTSPPQQFTGQDRFSLSSKIKIIPEGGWGWMICGAAFVAQLIVMGIHNSFGILYTKLLQEYKKSKAQTAWVGSVSIGIMYLFGPITSGLSERYGCKVVAFLGGLLCFLGLLLTSFVSDLSKLYMTYGVLWGIGSSFCYFPTLIAPGEYFCQRLSLVNGIVTAGSGIGTLTFGPVLQYILQRYGLAISLRILSGVTLLLLVVALTYKPFRSPLEEMFEVKRQPAPFFDLSIWQNKAFCVYTAAVSLFMLGYFIPYVHLVSHVEGLGISPPKAALLIGFMSIASIISRFAFGKFSDHPKVDRLFMTQMAIMGFGVTTTLSPLARSYASLVIVVVALGLFDGLYVVLIAVLNTDIVGVHKLSAALGSLYGVISFTLMLGPPCAGLIFDMLNSYHTAFYICGATTTLSSCLMFLIPWLMPNQQGGVFRRDSHMSRIENFLSSQQSTPRSRTRTFFFDDRSVKGSSGDSRDGSTSATGDISLYEADMIEMEYLKGFRYSCENFDDQDAAKTSLCESNSFSMDTSINTAINSSMSHRGSITKFLLQQQLQSQSRTPSPVSGSRRGSMNQSEKSSPINSISSNCAGSSRTSCTSPTPKSSNSGKASRVESRRVSIELPRESNSEESANENSAELHPEIAPSYAEQVPTEGGSRRGSGESTVVGSRWQSGRSTVVMGTPRNMTPKVSRTGDSMLCRSMKDPDMLHLLAARLLQATRQRVEDVDVEERESVV